ncbi:ATP-dependent helicase HrpB [Marinomonas sp. 15G1-11]|uniref:ATP-dependent helicase HrpB n=1 Tax=Marinomonas phaeophyticola TaxID=3004091 RepID=A0ABT4JTV6_9GAMM|nr:ATP-dependent helicase HrpB [Marinomonas sp. 15G1-11]MCZ2721753.1 ATP-dependent helicase HrpB [Marinomonas sp. 15G1-11]
MIKQTEILPIYSIIPLLKRHLLLNDNAILEAEPGAGKTTLVPIALLEEPWLNNRKIVMLEPRRLAAKSAAQRLSELLNESIGQTVGYRIRHETKISKQTRIEVVTEGILTRMLQTDPSLEDIGLIIFDEFHERSLHSDLALALCLQGRSLFREKSPLKLLVMSATLDTQSLEKLLNTSRIHCSGRTFPIEIEYGNLTLKQDQILPTIITQIHHALLNHEGDILVFLPGQKEIRTIKSRLEEQYNNTQLEIVALYGNLAFSKQQEAIQTNKHNRRKIVLSTNIAQTSLTIEGIRIVIDSGLSREAIFDPNIGITRLHTRKVTQSESIQRTGRAGRTAPGIGYRWWSQEQQSRLEAQPTAEIYQMDLAPLVIELARWGVDSVNELSWLDTPPKAHVKQAQEQLVQLDILKDDSFILTPLGETIASLPLDPRISRLILAANSVQSQQLALKLASLLSEKDPLQQIQQSDIEKRLSWLSKGTDNHTRQHKKLIHQLSKQIQLHSHYQDDNVFHEPLETARLLANAFPDRVGKRQLSKDDRKTSYKLANGRIADLPIEDSLNQSEWIVAIDMGSATTAKNEVIYLACDLPATLIETELTDKTRQQPHLTWAKNEDALTAKSRTMLGKLIIRESSLTHVSRQEISQCACQYIRAVGIHCLPWDNESRMLQERLNFLHENVSRTAWPSYENTLLLDSLEAWLAPYLEGTTHKNHLKKLNLKQILLDQLSWKQQQELSTLAPESIKAASGSNIKLDYSSNPPSLEVKLQEMFGCLETPKIGGVSVKIALLSPARKPLAITQDLPFFWKEVYPEVKKEMRGRYPKHPWPDDPLTALATHKTKRALIHK